MGTAQRFREETTLLDSPPPKRNTQWVGTDSISPIHVLRLMTKKNESI